MAVAFLLIGLCSCDAILDQDETDFGNGPDFIGFSSASVTAPFATDGQTKLYNSNVRLFGPGLNNYRGDVMVTVAIDPTKTTAVEGVNYTLDGSLTVTLNESNNYTASIPVTVLTEGIEAPVVESLVFMITDFSTTATEPLIISDTAKETNINIRYICFADLSGTYTMTNDYCDPQVEGMTITSNDDGGWDLSTADGGLLQYCTPNTGLVNAGSIIEVCGDILPSSSFGFCGSNGIGCITGGTWDAESGTLTLQHNDTFFGVGAYTSTYTRTGP